MMGSKPASKSRDQLPKGKEKPKNQTLWRGMFTKGVSEDI